MLSSVLIIIEQGESITSILGLLYDDDDDAVVCGRGIRREC